MRTIAPELDINQIKADIQEGDIIFTAIPAFLFRRVAHDSGSFTSHVGYIIKDENGEFAVLESAIPTVRKVPLEDFIARTDKAQVMIKRIKGGLSQDQVTALKAASLQYMGRFYHTGFKFESKRQFCSKFVYLSFKEALGIEIGKLQTLGELLAENPQAKLIFWRAWYFGKIPYSRITITPASQLVDEKLETVFANPPH
ncbi:YiiX/YebB-like N1pC/P60 family cysteine hydrolase [Neptuniibacter sp. QD37_11]|uniref:YiiX/YebB-like N1pC/P60 family cysteine hydrolase n=1 Tax=Neptuniibacter sp. QD37_11 TaxID=3398209 RepID=UPI0039F4D701